MNPRAVIFDVYSTILEVGPPPAQADALWHRLCEDMLGTPPPVSRTEFSASAGAVIARLHGDARSRGIEWPEIQWPSVVLGVIPSLASLPLQKSEEFIFHQMQLGRTLRLADGAADCLRALKESRRLLGIASNAQSYTLRELHAALQGAGLGLSIFDRDLRFWSFENGFSKPAPHAFRILSARLEARGIQPSETLMVGDRLDNDIEPARAHGWQVWHLQHGSRSGGGFRELSAELAPNRPR